MTKTRAVLKYLAALTSAAVMATGLPSSPANAYEGVSILIVGDSITQGRTGDYTWRYRVDKALNAKGTDFNFVGPRSGVQDDSMDYADRNFDKEHAARWGLALWEVLDGDDMTNVGTPRWSLNVGDMVRTYQPDIVTNNLGVNDFAWQFTAERIYDNQVEFIRQVREAKPDTDIIISQLSLPWRPAVAEYNAMVGGLEDLSTYESSIIVPRMPATTIDDTYDNTHPNKFGEVKIANMVLSGLSALGVDGATVDTPAYSTPGAPVLKASRSASNVRLYWNDIDSTSAIVYRKYRQNPWRKIATVETNSHRVTMQGDGRYMWKVQLVNHNRTGKFSNTIKIIK